MINIEYLKNNPQYLDIVERVIEYEENNHNPDHHYVEDGGYDTWWEFNDVGVHPTKIYQLESHGFVDRVFDTNSTTAYVLTDRAKIKQEIEDMEGNFEAGIQKVEHEFEDEDQLEGVFDDIVGYDDVKWLLRRAMSRQSTVNVLLIGPPGCGKTVFLRAIRRLDGAAFVSGKRASSSGFTDKMFEDTPRYIGIDELDDMDKSAQEALADYTEEGLIVETKGNGKRRELEINTKTFATANDEDGIEPQILDRFTDIHLSEYSKNEFVEVCKNILPRDCGQTENSSEEIAEAVFHMEGHANVRKAEDVAALSDGSDPQKVLEVLENYSKKESSFSWNGV